MATTENKIVLEPLDSDNYMSWSIRMKALLVSKGLWTAVTVDTEPPADVEKALAQVILHVKDHHLVTLNNCSTAKMAWELLKNTYEAKTNARKLLLRKEFIQLKMGAETLTHYVGRAKDMRTQLQAAGQAVTEQELAIQVLAGLPPAYSMITTVLTASDTALSVDGMMPKLLQAEQMILPEHGNEAALAAKPSNGNSSNGNSSNGRQRQSQRNCYYCGKSGHIKRDCKKLQQDRAAQHGGYQQRQAGTIAL